MGMIYIRLSEKIILNFLNIPPRQKQFFNNYILYIYKLYNRNQRKNIMASQNQAIGAVGSIKYTDSKDVSSMYMTGQIHIQNFDARANGMANIALKVNDAMGVSKGMDGIIKNYDLVDDYNKGGNSRFFSYNAPQNVSFFSIG